MRDERRNLQVRLISLYFGWLIRFHVHKKSLWLHLLGGCAAASGAKLLLLPLSPSLSFSLFLQSPLVESQVRPKPLPLLSFLILSFTKPFFFLLLNLRLPLFVSLYIFGHPFTPLKTLVELFFSSYFLLFFLPFLCPFFPPIWFSFFCFKSNFFCRLLIFGHSLHVPNNIIVCLFATGSYFIPCAAFSTNWPNILYFSKNEDAHLKILYLVNSNWNFERYYFSTEIGRGNFSAVLHNPIRGYYPKN